VFIHLFLFFAQIINMESATQSPWLEWPNSSLAMKQSGQLASFEQPGLIHHHFNLQLVRFLAERDRPSATLTTSLIVKENKVFSTIDLDEAQLSKRNEEDVRLDMA
jgi:hypothetical protein